MFTGGISGITFFLISATSPILFYSFFYGKCCIYIVIKDIMLGNVWAQKNRRILSLSEKKKLVSHMVFVCFCNFFLGMHGTQVNNQCTLRYVHLTHLCRVDSSTSTLWTGPFPFEGVVDYLLL